MSKMKNNYTESNKSSTEEAFPVEPSFLKPGTTDWESIRAPINTTNTKDETLDNINKKNAQVNETLKNILLQSLQMQHLIVLAGSGCSYHAGGPTMKDLWKNIVEGHKELAQSVADKINYDLKADNIEAFLSQAESAYFLHDPQINDFLNNAKEIILKQMESFLPLGNEEKLEEHKTFLHRLSRRRIRDQRLRVFTTNYDLCFERAAAYIGCVAIDGFSFTLPRYYDPKYFDYDIIRRPRSSDDGGNYLEGVFLLYKLHGSVNWEQTDNRVSEKLSPIPSKACIIYPAGGKYQQSYNQPFIESISQYLAAIREPNTCILVMGFGFNDNHLTEPLLSAVRTNPHLRLIVVDPSIKEKTGEGKSPYLNELFELSMKGEDVWFINNTFNDFVYQIPDLKSLTPAERLFKEIKGVSNSNE